ncbi:MAG: hypothetical protein HY318_03420 [Armatimonadetes bacterium]|nr:hypothetical protein [Armatimonadota bacterium]
MPIPQILIGDESVSRLIVGGNPFSGVSHKGSELDWEMRAWYTSARIKDVFRRCEECGINTFIGRGDKHIMRLLLEYWNEGGKIQWICQTAPEHASTEGNIHEIALFKPTAIYLHGGVMDNMVEKGQAEEIRAQLGLIHELGLPAGIAGHRPETHEKVLDWNLETDFHMVCLYNLTGRMGKVHVVDDVEPYFEEDREIALNLIADFPKPCIAYKVLAAGRRDPRLVLPEVYRRIKPDDAVLIGFYEKDHPGQVEETAELVSGILLSNQ